MIYFRPVQYALFTGRKVMATLCLETIKEVAVIIIDQYGLVTITDKDGFVIFFNQDTKINAGGMQGGFAIVTLLRLITGNNFIVKKKDEDKNGDIIKIYFYREDVSPQ